MHVLKVSSCIKEHMSLQGMCLVCVCLHVCACHSSPLCDIGGVSSGMLQGPALKACLFHLQCHLRQVI